MTGCFRVYLAAGVLVAVVVTTTAARAQVNDTAHQHQLSNRIEGPTVMLASLIQEALDRNPDLSVLRDQIAVARQRPGQEQALMPPMLEAQVWQWPINTLNPANTNMYMFMVGQEFPGRGKRDARAAVAGKDIALAEADVTIRARQIVSEIRQAY